MDTIRKHELKQLLSQANLLLRGEVTNEQETNEIWILLKEIELTLRTTAKPKVITTNND
jgi:hypothetical protein